MKILFITEFPLPNKISEKTTIGDPYLLKDLSKSFDLRIICLGSGNLFFDGKKISVKRINIPRKIKILFPLLALVKSLFCKYDKIICMTPVFSGAAGVLLSHLQKKDVIILVHNMFLTEYKKKYPVLYPFLKLLITINLRKCTKAIAISDAVKNECRAVKARNVIKLNYPGVDTDLFRPIKKYSKRKRILYLGRFSIEKGLGTLIKAAKTLKNIEFILIGEGPLWDYLKKKAPTNMKIMKGIPHRKIPRMIGRCDIVVLPSFSEGLGYAILEGMAMEKICIGSDIESIKEIIKEGGTGFLFKCGDYKSLIDVIRNVYQNETYKIACNARRFVLKNYNRSILSKKFINIIKRN